MTKYRKGTKGSIFLALAGVGHVILALVNLVLAFLMFTLSPLGLRNLTEARYRMLYIGSLDLGAFGLRHVLWLAALSLFASIVLSLFFAVLAFLHLKDDEAWLFLTISAAVLLTVTVMLLIFSREAALVWSLPVWVLTLAGGFLSRKPRVAGRAPQNTVDPTARYLDPGLPRPVYRTNFYQAPRPPQDREGQ